MTCELDKAHILLHDPEGQRTVVTETRGPAAGSRVVRGREAECMAALERTSNLAARGV